jgi:hypothetical protein
VDSYSGDCVDNYREKNMIKNKMGGGFTNFLVALVAITAIAYIFSMSINELNSSYSTSYSTSDLVGYNNTGSIANLSSQLDDQFTGQNTTSTEGGSLGQSFNQVYTIGVVSSRIIGSVTPALFTNLVFGAGNTLGFDPVLVGLAALVVGFMVIAFLWYILVGREL